MATKTVYAKANEGGFINTVSGGPYFVPADPDWYEVHNSSSSGANETENHLFFDTSNANTGLTDADTITSISLWMTVRSFDNQGFLMSVTGYQGTGAGAPPVDAGDWRVDTEQIFNFPTPGGLGLRICVPSGSIKDSQRKLSY